MATSTIETSGHDAILQLARELRTAVRERDDAMEDVLLRYNHAFHDRIHVATSLLRGVQREDAIYRSSVQSALGRYRVTIDGDADVTL